MKSPLAASILFGALTLAATAPAQTLTSCDESQSTSALMKCAEAESRRQDERLNETVRELMQKSDAERQNLLKAAQRAWAAFREAECKLAADEIRGDTEAPILAAGCLAQMTQERADQLGRQLETE
jgi:uncharacterized protein YecT (DUF1311 family)